MDRPWPQGLGVTWWGDKQRPSTNKKINGHLTDGAEDFGGRGGAEQRMPGSPCRQAGAGRALPEEVGFKPDQRMRKNL